MDSPRSSFTRPTVPVEPCPDKKPSPLGEVCPVARRTFLGGIAAVAAGQISPFALAADEAAPWSVAVIGHTGRGDYGHAMDTLWLKLPDVRLVAVADPVEEGKAKALERLGLDVENGFADYREMLAELSPDLVSVAPRHIDQHRDMVVAAAEAGAKGIYIEKPFCRDMGEANEIVAACEANGTKLAIAHRNRYHPVLPVLKELLEEGLVGQLLEVRARGKEDRRGGGLDLWVLGSHLLNLAHFFTGDPLACSAVVKEDGRPVTAADVADGGEGTGPLAGNQIHARFETGSGVPVFFDSIQNAGTREAGFGLQLIGTEGVVDLRGDAEPLAHFRSGNPFRPVRDAQPWVPVTSGGVGEPEPVENIREQVGGHIGPVGDLIAAIREDREPLCSARDGRVVVEMTMAVFESHRQGGARVEFPLARSVNPLADW